MVYYREELLIGDGDGLITLDRSKVSEMLQGKEPILFRKKLMKEGEWIKRMVANTQMVLIGTNKALYRWDGQLKEVGECSGLVKIEIGQNAFLVNEKDRVQIFDLNGKLTSKMDCECSCFYGKDVLVYMNKCLIKMDLNSKEIGRFKFDKKLNYIH